MRPQCTDHSCHVSTGSGQSTSSARWAKSFHAHCAAASGVSSSGSPPLPNAKSWPRQAVAACTLAPSVARVKKCARPRTLPPILALPCRLSLHPAVASGPTSSLCLGHAPYPRLARHFAACRLRCQESDTGVSSVLTTTYARCASAAATTPSTPLPARRTPALSGFPQNAP